MLKEYVCRVEGEFPEGKTECSQPVEVVSYKIGVCKVNNWNNLNNWNNWNNLNNLNNWKNLNTPLYDFLTGVYARQGVQDRV